MLSKRKTCDKISHHADLSCAHKTYLQNRTRSAVGDLSLHIDLPQQRLCAKEACRHVQVAGEGHSLLSKLSSICRSIAEGLEATDSTAPRRARGWRAR